MEHIFEGSTVEEAIEKGLAKLSVTKDEVDIEIVEREKKGFFKRSHHAIVKIVMKDSSKAQKQSSDKHTFEIPKANKEDANLNSSKDTPSEDESKGLMAYVKDGELKLNNVENGNVTIIIPTNMMFFKNNQLIDESIVHLTNGDSYRVEFAVTENKGKWKVKVDKLKLSATLYTEPTIRITRKLVDCPPSSNMQLKTKEIQEVLAPCSLNEVKEELKKLNIVFGIDENQIKKACSTQEGGEFIIAKGLSAEEGENGWLEYKVQVNEDKHFAQRQDGSIDFREGRSIPAIDEGQVLAIIQAPKEGKAGKNLHGQEILPKPVHPINVKKGKGVTIDDDGITVRSATMGRPSVEKRGNTVIVQVLQKFEHNSDVNIESGNIYFNGDLSINGSVEEGMKVKATGDIEIRGNLSQAKVTAGKSIILRNNAAQSNITAGESNKAIVTKAEILESILEDVQNLFLAIKQLIDTKAVNLDDKGLHSVIHLLVNNKFTQLPNKIRKLGKEIRDDGDMLTQDWHEVSHKLLKAFVAVNDDSLHSIADYIEMMNELKHLLELTIVPDDASNSITLSAIMNSEVYCSGDITVVNKGTFNTNVYCGGFFKVQGSVRGGEIFAKKGVEIDEVGSKGGVVTLIRVPREAAIKIKHAMADTVLQIGKAKYKLTREESMVHARLDDDERIQLH